MDFIQVLNVALEFCRVFDVLDFRPPPPEYVFRGLEPLYKESIQHFQDKCEKKYQEIISPKTTEDGETKEDRDQRFHELEIMLNKHCRLMKNMNTMLNYPHLKSRKHSDDKPEPEDADLRLGPERYIETPYQGYGFSNDYVRQWFAAIPGPVGQHFEREEYSRSNLTRIFQQILLAIIAGGAILAPMIILTFNTSRNVRLIVVSVATILFGIAFAIFSTSKENILAGTAAYAAIMVVYIGSSSPQGQPGQQGQ